MSPRGSVCINKGWWKKKKKHRTVGYSVMTFDINTYKDLELTKQIYKTEERFVKKDICLCEKLYLLVCARPHDVCSLENKVNQQEVRRSRVQHLVMESFWCNRPTHPWCIACHVWHRKKGWVGEQEVRKGKQRKSWVGEKGQEGVIVNSPKKRHIRGSELRIKHLKRKVIFFLKWVKSCYYSSIYFLFNNSKAENVLISSLGQSFTLLTTLQDKSKSPFTDPEAETKWKERM